MKVTAVKHQLWRLIKTLKPFEKRNFKLYATRGSSTTKNKFIKLFDLLDRLDEPDDELVCKKLKLTAGKYSNLKRHLYQQLLTSLRLISIDKEIEIELREQIDFAHILYGRGLYLDALRLLERTKTKAIEHGRDLLHLEIVEFQKLIEARHVTLSRQVKNKMDLLVNESAERSYGVLNTSELLNLNIQIHGHYIEKGHVRTQDQHEHIEQFYQSIQTKRLDRESVPWTFHQKINRFQSSMWYHYIKLDLTAALDDARNAYNLFDIHRHMTVRDPDLYLRTLYYISVFAYLTDRQPLLARTLVRTEKFLNKENTQFNDNTKLIGAVYRNLMRFNDRFLLLDYRGAYAISQELLELNSKGDFEPNEHRWGLFLYKFAAAAFALGEWEEALDYLNDITNMKLGILREDLLLNARSLQLMCHYELGNNTLIDYNLVSFSRQLRTNQRSSAEQHRILATTLRRLINQPEAERTATWKEFGEQLAESSEDPFELKARRYLNLPDWVAGHLNQAAALPGSTPVRAGLSGAS